MSPVFESSTITVSEDGTVTLEMPGKAEKHLHVSSWFWNGFRAYTNPKDGAYSEFTVDHPSTMVQTYHGIRGKQHTSQRIWLRVPLEPITADYSRQQQTRPPDEVLHEE